MNETCANCGSRIRDGETFVMFGNQAQHEACPRLDSPRPPKLKPASKNKNPLRKKGVLIPADNSFEAINRFVNHVPSPEYEELQWALLGLASARENEIKARMPNSEIRHGGPETPELKPQRNPPLPASNG